MRTQSPEVWVARPVRQLLYTLRWAILAFVLVAAWLVDFPSALVQREPIIVSVLVIGAVTAFFQAAGAKWQWMRGPAFLLVADIALVSVVTYFSDGIQSPFYPLYYMTVVTAAVEFDLSGALICAMSVAVISFGVDFISQTVHVTGRLIPEDVISTVPYLFLIALITGALRSRIRVLDESASAFRAEQAANERELEVAAEVQRAQLPKETPRVKGIRIATFYKPAREVGGDIYDFYPVEDSSLGILVADVSGKGVPAALLVSTCKYAVRASCTGGLSQTMSSANRDLLASTTEENFVTVVYGMLDVTSRTFRYVNAGHMPPIVVKAGGEVIGTEHSDPPLGIIPECRYVEQCLQLDSGDTLVLYTDGITDALVRGEGGIEAFQSFLSEVAEQDISKWGDELLRRTSAPYHIDDLTMVVLQLE